MFWIIVFSMLMHGHMQETGFSMTFNSKSDCEEVAGELKEIAKKQNPEFFATQPRCIPVLKADADHDPLATS
jgi:hypothetical protein